MNNDWNQRSGSELAEEIKRVLGGIDGAMATFRENLIDGDYRYDLVLLLRRETQARISFLCDELSRHKKDEWARLVTDFIEADESDLWDVVDEAWMTPGGQALLRYLSDCLVSTALDWTN